MSPWEEWYRANVDRLAQEAPAVWERIAPLLDGARPDGRLELLLARSGQLTGRIGVAGRPVYLHSSVDPSLEAARWAAEQGIVPEGCTVLLGLGLGYPAQALRARMTTGQLVILEPSPEVLWGALHNPALADLLADPAVHLLAGPWTQHTAARLWQLLFPFPQGKIRVVDFPARWRGDPDGFSRLAQAVVHTVTSQIVNANTLRLFAARWTGNFFANLPVALNHPPASRLFGQFHGVPAVVVAAGPSLSKNVEALRAVRDNVLIVAVGTALKPLLRAGVRPHLVITVDGAEANDAHFRDADADGAWLLYDMTCFPSIPARWSGGAFVLGSSGNLASWANNILGELATPYASGPSVSNCALDVVTRMGCDPVLYVGLDLAYTDGRSHARGTVYESITLDEIRRTRRLVEVEGWDGQPVWTDTSLLAMLTWFERRLATGGPHPLVIDATEGGARKPGMIAMPLRAALEQYARKAVNPEERLRELAATWQPRGADDVRPLLRAMEEAERALKRLVRQALVGSRLSARLEGAVTSDGEAEVPSVLRRLDRVDRGIRALSNVHGILALAFQPVAEFLSNADIKPEEEGWEVQTARKSRVLYEGLAACARDLARWMEESRLAIADRLAAG
ncbi:motility associated factor glycosyltransferase family protein [Caldinitratiruptor microaerophilus]|uniref:6-hydroxymethylpterin diphosphokinase MptE-like domain-containing protein n=1 Tax=Caldinitratiruptor microaerophilus TaxID=671077 RepID=A0AA35CNM3_9FIRM|nr:6-hydroxymethylpterin diphosphokinase MptE-like protein [Caldinitratiruptor microaerophilus]BDG61738.1 hypothetical protein caldi_28280 [Caldinitratiruptor microaerophilus]